MKVFGILLTAATFFLFAYFTICEVMASAGWYQPTPYHHWFLAFIFFGSSTPMLFSLAKEISK